MCVETIHLKRPTGNIDTGIGYKLVKFDSATKDYYAGYYNGRPRKLPLYEWVRDDNCFPIYSPWNYYDPGFHIFRTPEEAKKFAKKYSWSLAVLIEIQYREVIIEGAQYFDELTTNVIVAKEIRRVSEAIPL